MIGFRVYHLAVGGWSRACVCLSTGVFSSRTSLTSSPPMLLLPTKFLGVVLPSAECTGSSGDNATAAAAEAERVVAIFVLRGGKKLWARMVEIKRY